MTPPPPDPQLAEVVKRWPHLKPDVRTLIVRVARSSTPNKVTQISGKPKLTV